MTQERALTPQRELQLAWELIDDELALERAVADLASHSGFFAIDTERAHGYRYFQRAYLIQVKRGDSAIYLIDPTSLSDLAPLQQLLNSDGWILHSGQHDLPCLTELDLHPTEVFDTEIAARVLGFERVALAKLVEHFAGVALEKAFSAVDWSSRPLADAWLEYAAIDVEFLQLLMDELTALADERHRSQALQQEFEALLNYTPKPPHSEPWRRTSKITTLGRDNRGMLIVRDLWQARDAFAQEVDIEPQKIIPDSAIIAAATLKPRSEEQLLGLRAFRGPHARTQSKRWWSAIRAAKLSEDQVLRPARAEDSTAGFRRLFSGSDADPELKARLRAAREIIAEIAGAESVQVESLLTPVVLKQLIVSLKGQVLEAGSAAETVQNLLEGFGARPWQIALVCQKLSTVFIG